MTQCHDNYPFDRNNLLKNKTGTFRCRRLKFFRNKSFQITEEVKYHLTCYENELLVVDSLDGIRKKENTIQTLVKWNGFDKDESYWVLAGSIAKYIPVMMR